MSERPPQPADGEEFLRAGRDRVLRLALLMEAGLSITGACAVYLLPVRSDFEWLVFVAAALAALAVLPWALLAQRRQDRRLQQRVAGAVIVIGALVYFQRVAFAFHGPLLDQPDLFVMRPVLIFLPFIALAIIALLRARQALRVIWLAWAIVCVIALTGIARHEGMTLARDGMVALLLWLLVGMPLFILLLNTLPKFEEAVERSAGELARARGRAELLEQLEESERRFHLVIDSLEVGAWDRKDGVAWWSPRFYELIGYGPDEITPGWENLVQLVHPDDRDRAVQAVVQRNRDGVLDLEFRLKTKHRGYRWFHSRGRGQAGPDGRFVRFVGGLTDIDDRRSAETQLRAARDELQRLAYRDSLTGLHNRRHFDEQLAAESERARRNDRALSLLLLDLDHFKAYNDRYGHAAGDQALLEVGRRIMACLRRPSDLAVRLGGEEFAVLLPETDAPGALEVAQRVLDAVRAPPIAHDAAPLGYMTASIGLSSSTPQAPRSANVLFDEADRALYAVKNAGRNGLRAAGS